MNIRLNFASFKLIFQLQNEGMFAHNEISLNQEQHDYLYWEFPGRGGQQAVRMDNWKGLRKNIISEGNLEIELFRASSKSQS